MTATGNLPHLSLIQRTVQDDFDIYLATLRSSLEADLGLMPSRVVKTHLPDGVSFMITKAQRELLRSLGYTAEQIRGLSPEDAHAIVRRVPSAAK